MRLFFCVTLLFSIGGKSEVFSNVLQQLNNTDLKLPPELQKLVPLLMTAEGTNSTFIPICDAIRNQTQSLKMSEIGFIVDLAVSLCHGIATPKNNSRVVSSKSEHWPRCQRELGRMAQGFMAGERWAMTMFDATGKPGSGLLRGNLLFRGDNKECRDVSFKDVNSVTTLEGNMCSLSIWQMGRPIAWHVCLPKSCQDSDLSLVLSESYLSLYKANTTIVCTKDFHVSDDSAAMVAIVILVLFGVLVVTGTLVELYINFTQTRQNNGENPNTQIHEHGKINKGFQLSEVVAKSDTVEAVKFVGSVQHNNDMKGSQPEQSADGPIPRKPKQVAPLPIWQRVFLAFSIPRNTEKILSVNATSGTIGCLHGIRVMSMGWVILGHIIFMQEYTYKNPKELSAATQTMAFQLVLNAFFSVDTFFLLSGTLTSYVFLTKLCKKGRITIKEFAMYYVHRFWRLTPSMMMWIMIVASLIKYIGEGSNSWSDYLGAQNCRENWWTNLIYINNLYRRKESCIGVTWYLANDMQFYVVAAPLALIPWLYGSNKGTRYRVCTLLGFIISCLYVVIHLALTLWLESGIEGTPMKIIDQEQEKIYYKPYTRIAPYAIGLMVGWILWKTGCKVKMNKGVLFCGWLLSLSLILVLTLVTFDNTQNGWSHLGRVVEKSVSRPLWALAVSWIIWACATGYGGYINSILSWNGWLPMSRLTYSAFLIHMTVIWYDVQTVEYSTMYTATSVTYALFGYFAMSYVLGFILTVTVESPMMALEKIVCGQSRKY